MRAFILCVLLVNLIAASDQIPGAPQDHPILLRGGTIHPVSSEPFVGDLLFDNGVIVSLGPANVTTQGFEVIDVAGRHVYPGLISAGTTMGLTEIGAVRATRDTREVGQINPNIDGAVAYNPDSEEIPVTRSNGVLIAQVTPQGGIVSGTSAIMMADGWTWEDCILERANAVHVNWPTLAKQKNWWDDDEDDDKNKATENLDLLDQMMEDVRAYSAARSAGTLEGIDARWEAMLPVLHREIPLIIHAQYQDQIESAVYWSQKQNIRMILMGGADSWRVTDLLKMYDIPVIYQHTHTMPLRRWESYNTRYTVPAKLHEAGLPFCITGSNTYANQRNLPYSAAAAVSYGLPQETGLRAITLSTAEILGIADRVGSLEKGKDATLIVTNGNPLEISTNVEMAFIQGRAVDLNDRQKMLRDKYMERYFQSGLIPREKVKN